jgi:hypothetical protein
MVTGTRMVLLCHEVPGADGHYDWLIEPPGARSVEGDDARVLLSFRVQERIDHQRVNSFGAQWMENHRRLYLRFQGELSDGRGRVTQVARGRVASVHMRSTPERQLLRITGQFLQRSLTEWTGELHDGSTWRFSCLRQHSSARSQHFEVDGWAEATMW